MSVIIKLICLECKKGVTVGSWNTYTAEEPDKVGKFIWKHQGHNMTTICDTSDWWDEWPEDKYEDFDN